MKLSIIIPVYNTEKYLKNCIASLINQELKEKELIFINDGSTDNSFNILQEYKNKYDNILVLNQENLGQGVARNNALKIAKGDYITFVDSDDYISGSRSYSNLIKKCIYEDLDILIFNYNIVKNEKKLNVVEFKDEKVFNDKEIIGKFLLTNEVEGFTCNKIFRRDLLIRNNIKFLEGRKFEDIPVVVDCIMQSKKISFNNEKIYNYVANYMSTTRNININTLLDEVYSMNLVINKIKNKYKNQFNKEIRFYISKKLKLYRIYRFRNLLKRKLSIRDYIKINIEYIKLMNIIKETKL